MFINEWTITRTGAIVTPFADDHRKQIEREREQKNKVNWIETGQKKREKLSPGWDERNEKKTTTTKHTYQSDERAQSAISGRSFLYEFIFWQLKTIQPKFNLCRFGFFFSSRHSLNIFRLLSFGRTTVCGFSHFYCRGRSSDMKTAST